MVISYEKLWKLLRERGLLKKDLAAMAGIGIINLKIEGDTTDQKLKMIFLVLTYHTAMFKLLGSKRNFASPV